VVHDPINQTAMSSVLSKDHNYIEQPPARTSALDGRRGVKPGRSEQVPNTKASGGGVLAKMKRFVSKKAPPKDANGRQAIPQNSLQGNGQDNSTLVSAFDHEAQQATRTRSANLITTQHHEEF